MINDTRTRKKFTITAVTTWAAMQIQYVGDKDFATVEVEAAGDMLFKADDTNGTTTVDPDIGIDNSGDPTALGVVDLSTPHASMNTFGELERHINSMANWRCFLIGVLRDQNTDNKLDTRAAVSIRTDNGVTLFVDEETSGNLDQGFAITNQKFTYRPSGGYSTKDRGFVKDLLCYNSIEYMKLYITAIGDSNIEVYSIDDNNPNSVSAAGILLWENALVTATVTKFGDSIPVEKFLESHRGHRLLVFFVCAAANTAATLDVLGVTRHATNGLVPNNNYTGLI